MMGLSVSFTCAALIFLWVDDELTYNHYFPNRANLGRILTNQRYDKEINTFSATPGPLAAALVNEVPQIRSAVRANWGYRGLLGHHDKRVFAEGLYVDPGFLRMFSLDFIEGNPEKAFDQLHSMVITDQMAMKLFNSVRVTGKTITLDNEQEYIITAVFKSLPDNTRFEKLEWLVPFQIYETANPWSKEWGNNGIQTFVETQPGTDIRSLNTQLAGFIKKKEDDIIAEPMLFPMSDWRHRSNFVNGVQSGGKIEQVRLFAIIAWIIVLLACINFMNLATARSEKRAREVSVRKVLGGSKTSLIGQFMTEALIMFCLSVLLAVLLTALCLPAFNQLVDKPLRLNLTSPPHLASLLSVLLFCGVIAGSYPVFYLSSFHPIKVLKGLKLPAHSGVTLIRKGLVTAQFVISITLIICTRVIYQQVMYTKNRDLGMNKSNLIYLDERMVGTRQDSSMDLQFRTLRNALAATGVVAHAAMNTNNPFSVGSNSSDFNWKGKDPNSQVLIGMDFVTNEYVRTMDMQLVSGRDFRIDQPEDSAIIIINESMANLITSRPADAVGQTIENNHANYTVVGVVRDFVYNNMHGTAEPMIFFIDNKAQNSHVLYIRLMQTENLAATLDTVKSALHAHNPVYPVEIRFVDEEFDKLFKGETLVATLAALFAGLAIFISCLGLFGLAAYTAERRIKEIGIRKVLGTSITGVVTLLSADFLRVVSLSCLIAFPVAWWMMHNWLDAYPYRVSIQWWMFGLPALLAIAIALATVSTQAIKAALVNPIKSLRTE
jgi:predicted permease